MAPSTLNRSPGNEEEMKPTESGLPRVEQARARLTALLAPAASGTWRDDATTRMKSRSRGKLESRRRAGQSTGRPILRALSNL